MHRYEQLSLLIGFALSTLGGAAQGASTAPVLASAPSLYANCTLGGPGTNYVNSEVEPSVAVNPANLSNLIAAWQQDRWSDGGARGLVAGYSYDGGKTWNRAALPFSACAGGLGYDRVSDPWVSIGPDGTAYTVSVSFNQADNKNAVAAATSLDGGKTWQNLKVLLADDDPTWQFANDKQAVTAHPVRAGVAYVVWDRLELPNGNPHSNEHTLAVRGPTLFSKTVDGGRTWSAPQVIVNTPAQQQTLANQIVVDARSGTLYNFFNLISTSSRKIANQVAFVKSSDDGVTWSKPQIVADLRTVGVTDAETGEAIRTGDIIPEPAIDAATGQLYVVWQDSRFNGGKYDEVALSTSTDRGITWSAPLRVNTPTGKPAFTPVVKVNSAGTVGVTYFDFRNLAAGNKTTLPTDYWLARTDNLNAGFASEVHLAGPFDMRRAPNADGYFIGDYVGLDTMQTSFLPFFVQANPGISADTGNRTDVFSITVKP